MHDPDSPTNLTTTSDSSNRIVQAGGGINSDNPPEWFKKKAREMTKEEIWKRIVKSNHIKREAKQLVEIEIPKLIKYLDIIYPSMKFSTKRRFEEWCRRLEEDAK